MLKGIHMAWYGQSFGETSSHPFYSYPPTVFGLTKTTAVHGSTFSAQITGLPPGATGVSVSSSNASDSLTVSGGIVSGTFAAAGTSTLTLQATYNGISLTGSVAVAVS